MSYGSVLIGVPFLVGWSISLSTSPAPLAMVFTMVGKSFNCFFWLGAWRSAVSGPTRFSIVPLLAEQVLGAPGGGVTMRDFQRVPII